MNQTDNEARSSSTVQDILKESEKIKVGLVNFGRTHFNKLPQLGLIILNNVINQSEKYESEIFDYGEFNIYSVASDHISIMHYIAQPNSLPVLFLPELPLVDMMIQYLKNCDEIKYHLPASLDPFKKDEKKMNFVSKFCNRNGHNMYYFMEMMDNFFDFLPKVTKELEGIKFVGFYNNMANFIGSILVSEALRHHFGVKTIAGGPQITASYPYIKALVDRGLFFDFVVRGDADEHIIRILDEFIGNVSRDYDCSKSFSSINKNYRVKINFNGVTDKKYDYNHMIFDTSRGCPFKCKFCGEYKVHGQLAIKDPEFAADELIQLVVRHAKDKGMIWRIADSLINFDTRCLHKFLDRLIELRNGVDNFAVKNFVFYGYARPTIDEMTAKKLDNAGCKQLWMGVESFNDDLLKEIDKETTTDSVTDSIIHCLKGGLSIGLLLINPLDAIYHVPEDYLYKEILGMKKFVTRIINEVKLKKQTILGMDYEQQVFIAAHTAALITINGLHHDNLIQTNMYENWQLDDFYGLQNNIYDGIPKRYLFNSSLIPSINNYIHKDQILRRVFPITRRSKLSRINRLLDFDSIGCMYRPLKRNDYNILEKKDGKLDYF